MHASHAQGRTAWALVAVLTLAAWMLASGYFAGTNPLGRVARAGELPAWLERATDVAHEMRANGRSFLGALEPLEDPRVAPAALLLARGVAAPDVALLFGLAALGIALLGIALVARLPGEADGIASAGAVLIASSLLWLQAMGEADPGLLLGVAFLWISRRGRPFWLVSLALAWGLGCSPWAWVTLLPLVLGRALLDARARRSTLAAAVTGVVLAFALNPPALLHPLAWLRAMHWEASLSSLGTSQASFGARPALGPILGSLHIPGALLLAINAIGWPGRVRAGELSPLVFAAVILLGLPSGFASPAPLLILLPWAACEAGGGMARAVRWARARGRWRSLVGLAVVAVAVAPLLAHALTRPAVRAATVPAAELDAWLRSRVPQHALVAHDLGFAPPDTSSLLYIAIPFHSIEPEMHRGAYWMGWYEACDAIVVSERMVARFLRHSEDYADIIRFYLDVRDRARAEQLFGERAGARIHAIILARAGSEPLGAGWHERVQRGPASGLQGSFLANLGGKLVQAGRAATGAQLLEAALASGYGEVGIYLNLANAELALDRPLEAGRWLDRALVAYPDSPEVRYNLGIVLTRVGYWERAIAVLTPLRQQWPKSAAVTHLLGVALANSGHPAAALALLEEVLALDPGFPQREAVLRQIETLRSEKP